MTSGRSRRDDVPFDARHYEKLARLGRAPDPEQVFRDIHRRRHWAPGGPASGAGASLDQTAELRSKLPELLRALGIGTLLDLPCGDYGWMRSASLPVRHYIGADLLPEVVEPLAAEFGGPAREFRVLDLTRDPLPQADILLCRDCLVHLSFRDIALALANVLRSGIPMILTTTFPDADENEDIVTGDWRLINLERAPFHLPPAERMLNEACTEAGGLYADKSLGLWRTDELRGLSFLQD